MTQQEEWVFGDYFHTTFNGFEWSALSGWNNNRLYISGGSDIEVNITPFRKQEVSLNQGFTMEMEFSTANIENDNAVLCDLRNESGKGLLITASEASLASLVMQKFLPSIRAVRIFVLPMWLTLYLVLPTKDWYSSMNGIISGAELCFDDNLVMPKIGTIEAERDRT